MEKTTVLFDMDNTLIDRVQAAQDCYRYIIDHAIPEADEKKKQAMFDALWCRDDNGEYSKWKLFSEVAEEFGLSQQWVKEQVEEVWVRQFPLFTKTFDGAIETIRTLKRYYKVGILTNGTVPIQQKKFDVSGLAPEVDMFLIAGALHSSKPDPMVFKEACRRIGCVPQQAYYVGDNIKRDIIGSRNVGMTPIFIWRDDSIVCPFDDVASIHRIEEVLEVIPCPRVSSCSI